MSGQKYSIGIIEELESFKVSKIQDAFVMFLCGNCATCPVIFKLSVLCHRWRLAKDGVRKCLSKAPSNLLNVHVNGDGRELKYVD